jgi:cation diffusion facilitator family transporter
MLNKMNNEVTAVIAALLANILVAISKFVGYAISGSAAMLNESIHSVVDCGNQILLLLGNKLSQRKEDELYQFGHGRAKYFFSTIVATMLFFGGGALGVIEAINKIMHPAHEVQNVMLVLVILIFGLAVEGTSLRIALRQIHELNTEHLPIFQFLKESRHSEILIVFVEDFCAIIGLSLALVGLLLAHFTGNALFDAVGGLLIGCLLIMAALFLLREFYSLIVGERVTDQDMAKIKDAFNRKEIGKLIDMKTVHFSPEEILITGKVDIVNKYEKQAPDIVDAIEDQIRKTLPEKKFYIYIEVDNLKPNHKKKKG